MTIAPNIKVGTVIFYRVLETSLARKALSLRIWRKEILEISPNGSLIRMEGREGEDDIWMELSSIEILDTEEPGVKRAIPQPIRPTYATQKENTTIPKSTADDF